MSTAKDILILLAAGSARRMQSTVDDKTLVPLAGKPVFLHSLESFKDSGLIGSVIITYRDSQQLERFKTALVHFLFKNNIDVKFVQGGETRQDSVRAALEASADHTGIVHIHDAARPLVTTEAIKLVRAKALETGGAILAGRSSDTVKIAHLTNTSVESSPDRARVWTAETPQVFRTQTILKAYRKVAEMGRKVTDDSSAAESIGQEISLVENPTVNLKLTRPSDFALAEAILKTR